MDLSFVIIPIQSDADVSVSGPVIGDFVMLFQCLLQVEGMLLSYVFDSEIIYY